MKTRDEVLQLLADAKPDLAERFGVKRLAVCGSYAWGEQREGSDVDILVEVDPAIGLRFVDLAESIESLLGVLAEAVCKLEGFTYAPSDTVYWQHGHSTERDFIYVTTQNLSHDQLQALSDEVGESRSLLVMCSAFRGKPDRFPNLTIKKIPKAVMARCEWGKDDYSLRVENLPKAPPPPGQQEMALGERVIPAKAGIQRDDVS